MSHHSNAKGVAWVALVISIIALVFAWIAFNETGPSLDQRVESEVEQALETRQTKQEPPSSDISTDTTSTQPEPTPNNDEATTTNETDGS